MIDMMDSGSETFFTPPQAPRLRRSLGHFSNPSDKQASVYDSADEVPINNDEEERRERNRHRILDLQRKSLNSPGTPTHRRKSYGSGLTGLTNDQIAEHYTNCIKMSSENKITVKNAFGLHLIDLLKDVIKKPGESTNFQVASCSLDASTKIYACRVDNIHAGAYKLAGGLGGTEGKKKSKGSSENEAEPEEEDRGGNKKKKKTKKSKNIEKNLDNITLAIIDQRPQIEPIFKKISKMSTSSDVCSISNFLTSQLRSKDDSCKMLIDSSHCPFLPSPKTTTSQCNDLMVLKLTDLPAIKANLEAILNPSLKICPTFANFEFAKWDSTEEDILPRQVEQTGNGDLTFDLNCSVEQIQNSPVDGFFDGGGEAFLELSPPMNDEHTDFDQSKVENFGGALCTSALMGRQSIVRAVRLESVDDLSKLLSDKPSDFSYFKHNVLLAWAGPDHWKLQPSKRESKSNVPVERKKCSGKQGTFHLTYENASIKEIELGNKGLTKATLELWKAKAKTYPEDMHYDIKKLSCLFLKPTISIKAGNKETCEDPREIEAYEYANGNDSATFCPAAECSDDDTIDNGMPQDSENLTQCKGVLDETMGGGDNLTNFTQRRLSSSAFVGDNLVQQPYKIAKIDFNFGRVYRKINVKKLKQCIWTGLTKTEENKENPDQELSEMPGKIQFSKLSTSLMKTVPRNVADHLSIQIIFACLLHLANEKTLKLTGAKDLTDMWIEQG